MTRRCTARCNIRNTGLRDSPYFSMLLQASQVTARDTGDTVQSLPCLMWTRTGGNVCAMNTRLRDSAFIEPHYSPSGTWRDPSRRTTCRYRRAHHVPGIPRLVDVKPHATT